MGRTAVMRRFKEGDLVKTKNILRFLHEGKELLHIPAETYGVVKRAGVSVSVKFVGYRTVSVSESEIEKANPLDKMAWDFGDMDEHPVNDPGEA